MRRISSLLILFPLILLMAFPALAADYADNDVVGTVEALQKGTNDYGNLWGEMELCDTVADAARVACGTDVAIINGGDIVRNLDGGAVTWGELQALFAEEKTLAVAEISGAELLALLEYGVSYATVDMSTETLDQEASAFDGFPQVSGFTFTYDPTAPVGERIVSAKLSDGTAITEDMTLTLAATEYMLEGGYGYPAVSYRSAELSMAEALAQYFVDGTLASAETGRISRIGLGETFSISRPMILLISVAAILIVCSVQGFFGKGLKRARTEF